MENSRSTLITLSFTRPVYAYELRPGDVFTLADAPASPLTVTWSETLQVAPELQLVCIALPGAAPRLHLPPNTTVRAHRMVRTTTLTCLLCKQSEDIEVDLPRDGEPVSLVCARHLPEATAGERK